MPVRGTVKWYDTAKGYGFVVAGEASGNMPAGADVFVHAAVLPRCPNCGGPVHLSEGQAVLAEITFNEDKRAWRAASVRLADDV